MRISDWSSDVCSSDLKNNGELLQPPTDLRDVTPQLEAGGEYAWKPEARRWRILVAPPAGCGDPCHELARELDLVWRLFGNQADELDILCLGPPPDRATPHAAPLLPSPYPAPRAPPPPAHAPARVPSSLVRPHRIPHPPSPPSLAPPRPRPA